jgi:hypothetical protein
MPNTEQAYKEYQQANKAYAEALEEAKVVVSAIAP